MAHDRHKLDRENGIFADVEQTQSLRGSVVRAASAQREAPSMLQMVEPAGSGPPERKKQGVSMPHTIRNAGYFDPSMPGIWGNLRNLGVDMAIILCRVSTKNRNTPQRLMNGGIAAFVVLSGGSWFTLHKIYYRALAPGRRQPWDF